MVSVIIPVYNVEKYLDKCIESIINQTYKNLEIIIINDGSTDNSEDIIKKYIHHSNIVYLKQKNKGISETRNIGVEIANGEFILFVDSDDYIEADCIEKAVNKIKETNSDMAIFGYRVFYENNKSDKYKLYEIEDRVYTNLEVLDMIMNYKVKGFAWDKLYKKDLLKKYKFKFEIGRYVEDWFPVFKQIYLSNKICFVNDALYNYQIRQNSISREKNEKLAEDYHFAITQIKQYIEQEKIEIDRKSMNTFNINTTYNLIRNYYISHESRKKNNVYRKFNKTFNNNYNISFFNLIINNNSSFSTIIKIVLWKVKLFHLVYHI